MDSGIPDCVLIRHHLHWTSDRKGVSAIGLPLLWFHFWSYLIYDTTNCCWVTNRHITAHMDHYTTWWTTQQYCVLSKCLSLPCPEKQCWYRMYSTLYIIIAHPKYYKLKTKLSTLVSDWYTHIQDIKYGRKSSSLKTMQSIQFLWLGNTWWESVLTTHTLA